MFPTIDLIRAVFQPTPTAQRPVLNARADNGDGDGNTMIGYASVFDVWTEINSAFEGHFLERIAPGAFRKTLSERMSQVRVLFNHGMDPTFGDLPLGVLDVAREDDIGLWTETRLSASALVQNEIKPRLAEGSLDGMSFRFSVVKETIEESPESSEANPRGIPERTITEVRLHELGPVTFPAYEATTAGIRGAAGYVAWTNYSSDERVSILGQNNVATDLAASYGTRPDAQPEPTPVTPSRTTAAERRRRLLVIRGLKAADPTEV